MRGVDIGATREIVDAGENVSHSLTENRPAQDQCCPSIILVKIFPSIQPWTLAWAAGQRASQASQVDATNRITRVNQVVQGHRLGDNLFSASVRHMQNDG